MEHTTKFTELFASVRRDLPAANTATMYDAVLRSAAPWAADSYLAEIPQEQADRFVSNALRYAVEAGARLVLPSDDEWPAGLNDLEDVPAALWVTGNLGALRSLPNAVVVTGSRAATSYGEHTAGEIATAVVEAGRAVVTGGAFGIDTAATRATLVAGGTAIVFFGGGVDRFYPRANARLFEQVLESGGLLISEAAPGSTPTRHGFLRRSRLVAAAAGATVIVESGLRSGSMHLAEVAHSLGRPVGAVPGPITSASSMGANELIHTGVATLIADPEQLIELAGGSIG